VVGECVIGPDHFGFSISGAAAEYFVARPEWLHRIPEGLTFAQAALVNERILRFLKEEHAPSEAPLARTG